MYYLIIAFLVVVFDQLTKAIAMAHFKPLETLPITGFFNLVLVMNKGVSFSLFTSDKTWMPWLLTGIGLLITAGVAYWLYIEKNVLVKTALALILGGAIGNIIDRIRFKAVVDFLDFHAFGVHWPAFNIADMMICIGAAMILFEAIFFKGEDI